MQCTLKCDRIGMQLVSFCAEYLLHLCCYALQEDVIIPHNYTFYDLIINKARGKSGPLFQFDVHDDVRIVNDSTVEKNESHAGKVVERHWYDKNKHIFPASRWEVGCIPLEGLRSIIFLHVLIGANHWARFVSNQTVQFHYVILSALC